MKKIKYFVITLLMASLISTPLSVYGADGYDGIAIGGVNVGGSQETETEEALPAAETVSEQPIEYSPVNLSNRTESFFASVDCDITVALLASEQDYANGELLEHYGNFYSKDNAQYVKTINILKTISELSTHMKVKFVNPLTTNMTEFLTSFKDFSPEYGDLLIVCYSNFDGKISAKKSIIKLNDFYKTQKTAKGNNVKKTVIENALVSQLVALRNYRNINVGLISDISASMNTDYLLEYLSSSDYKFENISLNNEELNGYDTIMICAPVRDLSLGEIVLLDSFLSYENKNLIYFAPKSYRSLPNLSSFLSKWGIYTYNDYRICATKSADYLGSNINLLAHSSGGFSDNKEYIISACTPFEISNTGESSVTPILYTNCNTATVMIKPDAPQNTFVGENLTHKGEFPLGVISSKKVNKGTSNIAAFASIDFISSYFALQNEKNEHISGKRWNNLPFMLKVLDSLNKSNRNTESGLTGYAVSLADKGIETTSGYTKNHIIFVATCAVAGVALLILALLLIFGKRKYNGK